MSLTRKTFKDGEVFLVEGEVPKHSYQVISGNVELFTVDGNNETSIGLTGPGSLLSVKEFLNGEKNNFSLRAAGDVNVKALGKREAKALLQSDNDPSKDALPKGKNPENLEGGSSLRHPSRLATAPVDEVPETILPMHNPLKTNFFKRVFGSVQDKGTRPIEVRLARLDYDANDSALNKIARELNSRRGVRIKKVEKVMRLADSPDILEKLSNMEHRVRAWLREVNADVFVWGTTGVTEGLAHLRFFSAVSPGADQPALGDGVTVFPISIDLEGNTGDLLHATVLAANQPKDKLKRKTINRDLPLALDIVSGAIPSINKLFTSEDKADILATVGRCYSIWARNTTLAADYQRAVKTLDLAASFISEELRSTTWALLRRDSAIMMQSFAERTNDTLSLRCSAEALLEAIPAMPADALLPQLGVAQHRLGLALLRLDFESGDAEKLNQALSAFQSALQVYDRHNDPKRWAEIMGHIAQVTQIIGQQLKSPETLTKAVEASLAVLKVIDKDSVPLLWASTQNNLGSARFLLGKLTRDKSNFEEAATAFSMAFEIYNSRGASRMANITEKNLRRAKALTPKISPTKPPPVPWELEEPETNTEGDASQTIPSPTSSPHRPAPSVIFGQELMRE